MSWIVNVSDFMDVMGLLPLCDSGGDDLEKDFNSNVDNTTIAKCKGKRNRSETFESEDGPLKKKRRKSKNGSNNNNNNYDFENDSSDSDIGIARSLKLGKTKNPMMLKNCGDLNIPKSVAIEIGLHLGFGDICAISRCNRALCNIFNTDEYWKAFKNRQIKNTIQLLKYQEKMLYLSQLNDNNDNKNNINDNNPNSNKINTDEAEMHDAIHIKAQDRLNKIPKIRPIAWTIGTEENDGDSDLGTSGLKDKQWKRGVLMYLQEHLSHNGGCSYSYNNNNNSNSNSNNNDNASNATEFFGLKQFMPSQFFVKKNNNYYQQGDDKDYFVSRECLIRLSLIRELAMVKYHSVGGYDDKNNNYNLNGDDDYGSDETESELERTSENEDGKIDSKSDNKKINVKNGDDDEIGANKSHDSECDPQQQSQQASQEPEEIETPQMSHNSIVARRNTASKSRRKKRKSKSRSISQSVGKLNSQRIQCKSTSVDSIDTVDSTNVGYISDNRLKIFIPGFIRIDNISVKDNSKFSVNVNMNDNSNDFMFDWPQVSQASILSVNDNVSIGGNGSGSGSDNDHDINDDDGSVDYVDKGDNGDNNSGNRNGNENNNKKQIGYKIALNHCKRNGIKENLLYDFMYHFNNNIWKEANDILQGLRLLNQLFIETKLYKKMKNDIDRMELIKETINYYSNIINSYNNNVNNFISQYSVNTITQNGNMNQIKPSSIFSSMITSISSTHTQYKEIEQQRWMEGWQLACQENDYVAIDFGSPMLMIVLQIEEIMLFLARNKETKQKCNLIDLENEMKLRNVLRKESFNRDDYESGLSSFDALMELLKDRQDFQFDEIKGIVYYQPTT